MVKKSFESEPGGVSGDPIFEIWDPRNHYPAMGLQNPPVQVPKIWTIGVRRLEIGAREPRMVFRSSVTGAARTEVAGT